MKKRILLLLISAITAVTFAQNPTKNAGGFATISGTDTMAPSAIIEARSTTKGFLFPRMTTTQRNAISSPATSLVIFNTTTGAYNYYDGASWVVFGGGSTPTFQEVTNVGSETTNNLIFRNPDYPTTYLQILQGTGGAATLLRFYVNGEIRNELASNQLINIRSANNLFSLSLRADDDKEYIEYGNQGSVGKFFFPKEGDGLSGDLNFFLPEKLFGDYIIDVVPIIISANKTAVNDERYTVTANSTFTDPTGVNGKGYIVYVESGTATIGGVVYSVGSLVYRFYNGTTWTSKNFNATLTDVLTTSITNGDTTHAPDGNSVFDSLATKADLNGSTSQDFLVPTIPAGANSAISRNALDNALTGLTWKTAVKCSTTANHALSGTSNVDGVTIPSGTRVLARFQTLSEKNGIYISAAGAWTRATDCDSAAELESTTVFVQLGTLYKQTQWTQNAAVSTIDTDAATFVQVSGAGTYTNGDGIDLTANVFSVNNTVVKTTGSQTLSDKTFVTPILGTPVSGNLANCTFPTLNQNTTGSAASLSADIPESRVTNLVSDLAAKQATLTASNVGTFVTGNSAKTTPVDADLILISDSAASGDTKKVTLTNAWTNYFKSKADALYEPLFTHNTAFNKNFGTGTTNVPEIGSTLVASKAVVTDANGKLATSTMPASYLDATSSIQTQIDNRTKIVVKDLTDSSTVTGTTSETLCKTITISANTFATSDFMNIVVNAPQTSGTNNGTGYTVRIKVNSTNNFSTATTIATATTQSRFYPFSQMSRHFELKSNTLKGIPFTISVFNDIAENASYRTSTALVTTSDFYLYISIQPTATTESYVVSSVQITN